MIEKSFLTSCEQFTFPHFSLPAKDLLHSTIPNCSFNIIPLVNLWSSNSLLRVVPKTFVHAGSSRCNELPQDIRNVSDAHIFKVIIQTHLFQYAFNKLIVFLKLSIKFFLCVFPYCHFAFFSLDIFVQVLFCSSCLYLSVP